MYGGGADDGDLLGVFVRSFFCATYGFLERRLIGLREGSRDLCFEVLSLRCGTDSYLLRDRFSPTAGWAGFAA